MNGKKLSAQVLGGALAAISVWAIHAFTPVVVPAEISVAFGTVFAVVVSLLTPDAWEE